jgi:hypothetical protein
LRIEIVDRAVADDRARSAGRLAVDLEKSRLQRAFQRSVRGEEQRLVLVCDVGCAEAVATTAGALVGGAAASL